MNTKEISKLYGEFIDYINRFIQDKGDNRLECENALHKLLKALQEDKWISIEDELPKAIICLDSLYGYSKQTGVIEVDYGGGDFSFNGKKVNITHWMNIVLPKPPITNKPNKPKKRGGCNP